MMRPFKKDICGQHFQCFINDFIGAFTAVNRVISRESSIHITA